MKTEIVSSREWVEAVTLLHAGGIVGLPTETVYGLAADALNPIAVAKIFEVKERPRFDPLIVHLPDRDWLEKISSIGIFNFWEIISSVSNRRKPVCCSKIFPTRDFPVPIKPISTMDLAEATSQYPIELRQ